MCQTLLVVVLQVRIMTLEFAFAPLTCRNFFLRFLCLFLFLLLKNRVKEKEHRSLPRDKVFVLHQELDILYYVTQMSISPVIFWHPVYSSTATFD